jgi:cysteine-S-conjugate beta-lyase
LEAAQQGAQTLAERLMEHPGVARVLYPGLPSFSGGELHFSQAQGAGAILSFELRDRRQVADLLRRVKLPIIAPSLGGVETILTHCWTMSHAAIPGPVKERLGIRETLVRLSVGIEDPEDLWDDLAAGLESTTA